MIRFTCYTFKPIVKECKGCKCIIERIPDKVKICTYSFHPEIEWDHATCKRFVYKKNDIE